MSKAGQEEFALQIPKERLLERAQTMRAELKVRKQQSVKDKSAKHHEDMLKKQGEDIFSITDQDFVSLPSEDKMALNSLLMERARLFANIFRGINASLALGVTAAGIIFTPWWFLVYCAQVVVQLGAESNSDAYNDFFVFIRTEAEWQKKQANLAAGKNNRIGEERRGYGYDG